MLEKRLNEVLSDKLESLEISINTLISGQDAKERICKILDEIGDNNLLRDMLHNKTENDDQKRVEIKLWKVQLIKERLHDNDFETLRGIANSIRRLNETDGWLEEWEDILGGGEWDEM